MAASGASKGTRDQIGIYQANREVFGTLRAQVGSFETIETEDFVTNRGTINELLLATSITISAIFTAPAAIINAGNNDMSISTAAGAAVGSESILVAHASTSTTATHSVNIGTTNTISADGDYSVVVGSNSTSDGAHNIIIGRGNPSGRTYNVMVGFGTSVSVGDNNIVLGRAARADSDRIVVIGDAAYSTRDDSIAIGRSARVVLGGVLQATRGIAMGFSAQVQGFASIAIGADASATEPRCIVLGNEAVSTGDYGVSIGTKANVASVTGAIALGGKADVNGDGGVCVGYNSKGDYGVAVGSSSVVVNGVAVGPSALSKYRSAAFGTAANASGEYSLALGDSVLASNTNSVVIGRNMASRADNEVVFPGVRQVRITTTTTNGTAAATNIMQLLNDGEVVSIEGYVTASSAGGTVAYSHRFSGYMARRAAGIVFIHTGTDLTNNPHAKTYSASLAINATFIRLVVTGAAAETVSWVATISVYGL